MNETSPPAPGEGRILVWDLPTRLFHWLFAGCFLGAFTIAQVVDDEDRAFTLHMLLGGVMAFLVLWRVVWGFVGPAHARFASFAFGPRAVMDYMRGALTGTGERHVGHNPGSSVAIFLLLVLALGLALSGAFMARGGEALEEAHEVLAYAMIAVVGVHVAGVVWHTIRHRENITRSMLDGHKVGRPSDAIGSARPVAAGLLLALAGLWTWGLVRGYDPAAHQVTLPLVGMTLRLGEGDEHEQGHDGERRRYARERHDDDD